MMQARAEARSSKEDVEKARKEILAVQKERDALKTALGTEQERFQRL